MELRFFLYNLLSYLLLPFFIPLFFINNLIKGRREATFLFDQGGKNISGGQYIWIQAASAGEALIARTIFNAFKDQLNGFHWLVVTTTHSGYLMAKKIFHGEAEVVSLPGDFSFITRRWIKNYPAAGFLIIENEIWTNLVACLAKNKVKLALVNGRVNDRTWRRYKRIKYFLRASLGEIHLFCVQTERDAERLIALGADSNHIYITGNAKYDQEFSEISNDERIQLLQELGLADESRLLVAGSTHAGEEEIILEAFKDISAVYPNIVLLIAPRHPERVNVLKDLLKSREVNFQTRSFVKGNRTAQVLLLDTFGELSRFYGLAYIAFVGGSLVPIGGHNLLEPAAQGCPVLYGPYTQNFREIVELLSENGVGFEVRNSQELKEQWFKLLNDHSLRQAIGVKAQSLVASNRGATQRMSELFRKLLRDA